MAVDITMLRQALREADVYICSSVNTERFQTVENNWGILYLQYPEVYDRFCTTGRDGAEERLIKAILQQYNHPIFLDIACGTGRSLLPYLDIIKEAYGVDISKEMLRVAHDNLSAAGYKDVELALGDACKLPYPIEKFDVVNFSFFAAVWDADPEIRLQKREQAILEALRVLKTGGTCIFLEVTPGWHGGSLAPVILGKDHLEHLAAAELELDQLCTKHGFEKVDFISVQNYASPEEMASICGFIFGRQVIRHILETRTTQVKWKFRLYMKVKN